MALSFVEAEKRIDGMLVFPPFNLTVEKGQVVAIYSEVNIRELLIQMLMGDAHLSQGEIKIKENEQSVGMFFLDISLYERLTIEEMLKFTKGLYGSTSSIQSVIEKLQLESKKRIRIRQLSYSEQKRVQLACLIVRNPSIYIFEEPDQNLDIESKRIYLTILDELRQENKVVLILTGNLEGAITAADEVVKLSEDGLVYVQLKSEDSDDEMEIETTKQTEEPIPISLDKIPSKVNDKIVLFHPPEIDYIESSDGQSLLYVNGEVFPCTLTLQKLEIRLLPFGFFRCHRSYIVNLKKVREIITWTRNSYSLVLENSPKSTIPLSKSKMAELKEMMGM